MRSSDEKKAGAAGGTGVQKDQLKGGSEVTSDGKKSSTGGNEVLSDVKKICID